MIVIFMQSKHIQVFLHTHPVSTYFYVESLCLFIVSRRSNSCSKVVEQRENWGKIAKNKDIAIVRVSCNMTLPDMTLRYFTSQNAIVFNK